MIALPDRKWLLGFGESLITHPAIALAGGILGEIVFGIGWGAAFVAGGWVMREILTVMILSERAGSLKELLKITPWYEIPKVITDGVGPIVVAVYFAQVWVWIQGLVR